MEVLKQALTPDDLQDEREGKVLSHAQPAG